MGLFSKSILFLLVVLYSGLVLAEVNESLPSVSFQNQKKEVLSFEILNDDIVHFVYSCPNANPDRDLIFSTSPYVAKGPDGKGFEAPYAGPKLQSFKQTADSLETMDFKILVDLTSLCFEFTTKTENQILTRVCRLGKDGGLSLEQNQTQHVYGLGEQFLENRFGSTDGDWLGQIRSPGNATGNAMVSYPAGAHGAVGNAQFPILYAVNEGISSYSLFIDEVRPITWDFTKALWKISFKDDSAKGFLTVAAQLPFLRQAYMDLVGHPPVPPKKAFGLWVSQYGYDGWDELDGKLKTLRKNHFPLDGFVLDLQWFGNVKSESEESRMGSLEFDESSGHFPNPKEKISFYKRTQGLGFITIEESYVAWGLKEAKDLADREFLVTNTAKRNLSPSEAEKNAFYMNTNPWWGLGGMIDWTSDAAGAYWHKLKRQPLIDLGVMGHWTDLGEPEMFEHADEKKSEQVTTPFYAAGDEVHAQNIFSLKWHQSIFDGYKSHNNPQRPLILSRSGGSGSQRYGAAMWSGDIGSRLGTWATHLNVQMQMSLSGMDYFGADVGGFHREDLDGDLNDLYTKWFAGSSLFDVPVRPHTEDLNKNRETAPDRVGDLQSNLANIRLRYELSPYFYSLAHLAYQKGEPIVPPVFYYYPKHGMARGNEKLIGRKLLATAITKYGASTVDVHLPEGTWTDYSNLKEVKSSETTLKDYPALKDGVFRLPLFALEGAIIPKMFVDEKTFNILGKREDHVTHTELIAKIFPSPEKSEFTLFEDDGVTVNYQKGEMSQTTITQRQSGELYTVTVEPTKGSYTYEDPNNGKHVKSPHVRQSQIELVVPDGQSLNRPKVTINQKGLRRLSSLGDFLKAKSGFYIQGDRMILAKSGPMAVSSGKQFLFDLSLH